MSNKRGAPALVSLIVLGAGAVILLRWIGGEDGATRAARDDRDPPTAAPRAAATTHEQRLQELSRNLAAGQPGAQSAGRVLIKGTWGSKPGAFGRRAARESNPEAPMGLAVDRQGNVHVLDQVNRRIQRFRPDGSYHSSMPAATTAQDLLVDDAGRTLVLDRLGSPGITVHDPAGGADRKIPILSDAIKEGGAISGVFSTRGGIFVEKEHDSLVQVADSTGAATSSGKTLPGRPTRDGQLFIRAGIIDRSAGRVYVQAHGKDLKLAWETPLNLGRNVLHLLLLDSDNLGNTYLGLEAGEEDSATHDLHDLATLVIRLDRQGKLSGVLTLPPSTADPAETFRPLAVSGAGTIYHLRPSSTGLTITTYSFKS